MHPHPGINPPELVLLSVDRNRRRDFKVAKCILGSRVRASREVPHVGPEQLALGEIPQTVVWPEFRPITWGVEHNGKQAPVGARRKAELDLILHPNVTAVVGVVHDYQSHTRAGQSRLQIINELHAGRIQRVSRRKLPYVHRLCLVQIRGHQP